MSGRLGAGAGGGGIISPYTYQAPVPVVAASVIGAAAASGAPAHQRNRVMANNHNSSITTMRLATPTERHRLLIISGMSSEGGYPATQHTHTTSSGSNYPYVNPMGRRPSPGPSVLTGIGQGGSSEHSSSAYGGMAAAGAMSGQQQQQHSAKEMEAMRMRVPYVINLG